MGYVMRVRFAVFFAGAAAASLGGMFLIMMQKDYKVAHDSISKQMKNIHESLNERISAIEKLKAPEAAPAESME